MSLLAAGLALGCAPRLRLTVLHAPDVTVPPQVRRLGPAEIHGADPAARRALDGLRDQLRASGRFAWVDDPADADAVARIEPLGATSEVDRAPSEGGWTATRTAKVAIRWELRARDGRTLDRLDRVEVADRWTAAGDSPHVAEAEVVGSDEAADALYWSAGAACARRIAPLEEEVVRPLAVGGDARLRLGHLALVAGDWDQAVRLWSAVARSAARPAVRARAHLDLAVALELRGELRRALEEVERSLAVRATGRAARYRGALVRAVAETRPLRRPVPGGHVGEDR